MRKVLSLVLIACLGVCLVACGSSKEGASSDPDYKEQKVTYKDHFQVTCINDQVVCNKEMPNKPDVLVVTFEVKNIGKTDEKFSTFANINAKQGDESIYSAYLKDKKGKPYEYYADQIVKAGDTTTIKYDYKLANHEDDVVLNFNGYTVAGDAGKMTFKVKGRQTKQNAKYEEESKKEYESKAKIKEADIGAAKITVPKGWFARSVSTYGMSLEKIKDEGPTQIISFSTSTLKIDNAKSEAKRYMANFGDNKTKIKTYKIDGQTCYGFEPVDTQFYIYAKSSDNERVEMDGMGISYKDAKSVLDKCVDIK